MDDKKTITTRHLADAAAVIADAVDGEPRTLERFQGIHGDVTVIRDDNGTDVVLHDKGVAVHVRFD
jgi:hypothetical protein